MLCMGLEKSLLSPRLKLIAQGMAQCTDDQSQVWYHSAIQAPLSYHDLKICKIELLIRKYFRIFYYHERSAGSIKSLL